MLFAQKRNIGSNSPQVTITGKVLENTSNYPLEYATIIFTNLDNNKITGGVTNTLGVFEIQIPKGLYSLKVEYIGFKTKKLPNREIADDVNLGTILLSEDAESLDEVEIIAEKSTVEIRLDKKIYNVGKDMTLKGGNASDVLDNVPSVNVDAEGAVSLRGNENVRILIDGKPSALVGLNGTDALRNLPAEAIEKVEVITSPSARYDAEGTAGILNIILRKGKITGFNGSINISTGYPDMFRVAPNLNYRTKKFNLFTNLGYSYRKGPGNSQSFFTNFNSDGTISGFRNEDRIYDRKNNNYNASLGLEYYLSKSSSLTGTFFYRKNIGNDIATNVTDLFDSSKNLLTNTIRIEDENENGKNNQFSLNYTNNFDNNGQKLSIDLQYGDSSESENSPITENGMLREINSQVTDSKTKLLQVDYVVPIGEKSQLEVGHKSDLQNIFSDFQQRDENRVLQANTSNAIDFKQYIYAFYSQFGSKIDKFSYLLGLRTEITDVDLKVLTTNQFSDKNYTKWFPTINFGYELSENENLTLGYARRIRRPSSWFINPFESRSSATSVFKGNPDLNPSYTSSLDIGYTTKIKRFDLGTSIYYQRSTDIIQITSSLENRDVNNNNEPIPVTIRTPLNLNGEDRYGVEFTANYKPSRKVRLSGSFNYFKFRTDAFEGDGTIFPLEEVNESSWFARLNSRVTLPQKIQWQTRLMYRGPQDNAQGTRDKLFTADLSFSKDLFKDKATLVLNVRDLFNSRKRESFTYLYDNVGNLTSTLDGAFQWRERQISLNFTYRFNQKKKREIPQKEYYRDGEGFGG